MTHSMANAGGFDGDIEPAGDLGKLQSRWELASYVGECNFCTDTHIHVLNVTAARVAVRICKPCLDRLNKGATT